MAEGTDPVVGVTGHRVDLGSILLPLPEAVQLQVQMDPEGRPQSVYLVTDNSERITVEAFAAPRSPGLWQQTADVLVESLRDEGARVTGEAGPWGKEIVAITAEADLRFIGIDGPRWMVRGVVSGPPNTGGESSLIALARSILSDTVVRRGAEPYPAGASLPLLLPEVIINQIELAYQQQLASQLDPPAEPIEGNDHSVPVASRE
ncbi:DUF3710 domain-containing protein [Rhodococcus cerastii]|nr:DUF3710 domain-containing protein [Rhodococcus cerastii]